MQEVVSYLLGFLSILLLGVLCYAFIGFFGGIQGGAIILTILMFFGVLCPACMLLFIYRKSLKQQWLIAFSKVGKIMALITMRKRSHWRRPQRNKK